MNLNYSGFVFSRCGCHNAEQKFLNVVFAGICKESNLQIQ
jgi:hypothetical protein